MKWIVVSAWACAGSVAEWGRGVKTVQLWTVRRESSFLGLDFGFHKEQRGMLPVWPAVKGGADFGGADHAKTANAIDHGRDPVELPFQRSGKQGAVLVSVRRRYPEVSFAPVCSNLTDCFKKRREPS